MGEYVDTMSCTNDVEDLCVMCMGCGLGSATTGSVAQAVEICKIKKLFGRAAMIANARALILNKYFQKLTPSKSYQICYPETVIKHYKINNMLRFDPSETLTSLTT